MKKEIKEFCSHYSLTEKQFYGEEKVGGDLYLRGLTAIPAGFNPTVGGSLDLSGLTAIPAGFNPTVGGDLYLRGLTAIPAGFNPTVGGDLYLSGLTAIPAGFNPTVGGYLYLRYGLKASTKKPVGKIDTPKNKLLFFDNGRYVKADGMFTEVLSKKGNIYRVKKVHSQKEFYLVTNGEFHAHGDTLEKAKEDFRFKVIADKLKKDPIKEDTIITTQYYRIVTGACEFGVKNWMDNTFNEKEKASILKNGIKAKDLLPILKKKSAYGLDRFNSLITF